jgi:hypothetical protein
MNLPPVTGRKDEDLPAARMACGREALNCLTFSQLHTHEYFQSAFCSPSDSYNETLHIICQSPASVSAPAVSGNFATPHALPYSQNRLSVVVIPTTEARLVNTLTSTSLTSRSRVISALGRYNQKCDVVENVYV